MDKVLDKIAALGVPGLVLLVAMATSGYVGAAALTSALAMLGFGTGMVGGIAVLGVLALITQALAVLGLKESFRGVVERLKRQGISVDEIKRRINRWPLSRTLREELKQDLDRWG